MDTTGMISNFSTHNTQTYVLKINPNLANCPLFLDSSFAFFSLCLCLYIWSIFFCSTNRSNCLLICLIFSLIRSIFFTDPFYFYWSVPCFLSIRSTFSIDPFFLFTDPFYLFTIAWRVHFKFCWQTSQFSAFIHIVS